jgi:hypothetical protein
MGVIVGLGNRSDMGMDATSLTQALTMLLKITRSSPVVEFSFSKNLMKFLHIHAHTPPNESPIVIVISLLCLT